MSNDLFEITKILGNIKNHDFSVADLKITKAESEIITKYLGKEKRILEFDEKMGKPII